jgi:hypothetical protein
MKIFRRDVLAGGTDHPGDGGVESMPTTRSLAQIDKRISVANNLKLIQANNS